MANGGKITYQVGFDIQKQNLNQLKTILQDLQKMKISDVMKINETDINSARSMLTSVRQQAGKVEEALQAAFNAKLNTVNIETFKAKLSQSNITMDGLYQSFSKMGASGQAAFRNLTTQLLSTNIQLKESHQLLDKMATTLGNTVKWTVASTAVNTLTRSVEQAWGYVKSLDTSLNDIRIVTGKSADEMADFAVKANDAAKALGQTTTDYTNAALIYAQQGLSDSEIEERAKITLKAANVTGQSTDEVSEQLTAVWNGYKVTAEEAQLYIDRLAAVAATSASNLEELSTGMSKVASAAAAMGVGEDQLAAQLATIISVTRQAPQSVGTALRTVYARISDIKAGLDEDGTTLGNYSGRMAQLGIQVLDMNGNLRDMGAVMEEIGAKWGDLTREQQVYLAQTMAGQRQYNNLLALFDNFAQYNKELNIAQNAAGTLQKQQDTYMESTNAHLTVLKASVEDIYDSLMDQGAMTGVNKLVDGLSAIADLVANFVDSISGGVGVLRILGSVGLTVFSNQIGKSIQTTINNMQLAKQQAHQFEVAIQEAQQAQKENRGNEYTQFIAGKQQSLLKMGGRLSVDDFNMMQENLQHMSKNSGELEIVRERYDLLGKSFSDVSAKLGILSTDYKSIDDMLASADGVEIIKERLQLYANTFQEIGPKQLEFKNDFNQLMQDIEKGSGTAAQSFQAFQKSGNILVYHLNDAKIFDKLPQSAQDAIIEANNELQKLDFSKLGAEAPNKITQIFSALSGNIDKEINNIKKLIDSADKGQLEHLEQRLKQLQKLQKQLEDNFDGLEKRASKTINVQNITKTIGGISQLATSIKQIQNLGSILKNADLSSSEKLLQIMTNIGSTIPMVISGFTSLKSVLGTVGAGWVGGILLAITAITQLIQHFKEAEQAIIDANNKIIQSENKKQEELQANKQLYASLDELNKKYQEQEITRLDLKNSVEDLIDQYELEGDAAERLRRHYTSLNEQLEKMRQDDAEAGLSSAERAKNAAEGNVNALNEKYQVEQSGLFGVTLGGGFSSTDEADVIKQALLDAGFQLSNNNSAFVKSTSSLDLYNSIQQAYLALTDGTIDQRILNESEFFKNLKKYYDDMQPTMDAYKNTLESMSKYATELAGLDIFNSSNVNDAKSYMQQRQKFINEIQNNENIQTEDPAALADAYIKENYRALFTQFNDYSSFIDKFTDKFGKASEKTTQQIINQLSTLDTDHMSKLMELVQLHPQILTNWQQFKRIIQGISQVDLSNVNVKSPLQEASETYTTHQTVGEAVRNGETISSEQFEKLHPSIQKFFNITIDGTYKMMGVVKDFQQAINEIKLSGFYDNINQLNKQIEYQQTLIDNGVSEDLKNKNLIDVVQIKNADYAYDDNYASSLQLQEQSLLQAQLDELTKYALEGTELKEVLLPAWQDAVTNLDLSQPLADAIAAAVQDVANGEANLQSLQEQKYVTGLQIASSAGSIQELKQLRDIIGDQAFIKASIDLTKALDLQGLDSDELKEYSNYLQQVADNIEELDDNLDENDEAAQDVAKSIMKMNDGLETLSDNWENWFDILNNSSEYSEEYAKAMNQTKAAMANLLDISQDYISSDFIKKHLEEITAAANGSEIAIDELKSALLEDIVAKIVLDNHLSGNETALLKNDLVNLQTELQEYLNNHELVAGAVLNDESFVNAANELIKNSKLTVDQANAIFDSLGFETHFQTTSFTQKQRVPRYKTRTTIVDQGVDENGNSYTETTQSVIPMGSEELEGTIEVPAMSTNENAPVIDHVVKKADSNFSNFSSNNSGGSSLGGSSGSKSGGGGSSGKSSSPDTSQKDTKKPIEDTRDIYHDINIELQQIERQLDRIQDKQDRLYGKDLLDNLIKQQEILEKHKKTLAEKQKIQIQDLQNQQAILANLGVEFDKYGNIANYMDILGQKQNELNAKTQQYNDLVQQYNAETNADKKKQIAEQIEAINKQLKTAEDDYKDLEKGIKDYDSLRKDMEDLVDEIEEETQKQIEIEIKKFRMELEIRLDMGEAQRDWNKFRREVLEHTNVLQDSDFSKIYADAQLNAQDIESYFNIGGSQGSIQALLDKLTATKAEIEKINETGISGIYGDNEAQAMEDFQNDLDELMKQMEDIEGLVDDIYEAYLDTIDDVDKNFDKQIEDYQFIGELIEHDIDLLTLLYGEKNYDAMQKYYTTLQENNNKQLDSLRQQRDFWKEQWDAAVARGDTNAAKEFEKNYKDTIKNLNSLVQEAAKNLQSKYENAINKIFDTLDKRMTNGKGSDYISMEWDLMQKNEERYLDTINSAYAIQDTQRKYQDAINDANSIKSQRALKKLMDEQLDILKNKEKISQYDVDRAEKMLQIEQARIALEDVRAAKTTMRLKRDSQGNYSYEYMADQDAISDAEGQLAAAQQDLYNFDKEAYKANLNEMLSAWKEFQSQYKEIMLDTELSDEERTQRLQLLQEQYGEYINGLTADNVSIRNNLEDSALDALAGIYKQRENDIGTIRTEAESEAAKTIEDKQRELFEKLSGFYDESTGKFTDMTNAQKQAFVEDLVPEMNSGIQSLADNFIEEDGFLPACETAFENLDETTNNYTASLDQMATAAGTDLGAVKGGTDEIAEALSPIITDNQQLITDMEEQLTKIQSLVTWVDKLAAAYEGVFTNAQKAVEEMQKFREQQQLDAAEAAAEATKLAADIALDAAQSAADTLAEIYEALANAEEQRKADEEAAATGTQSEHDRLIEGLAGSFWTGSWSNGDERVRRMIEAFGEEEGRKLYDEAQDLINNGFTWQAAKSGHNGWEYYDQFSYEKYRKSKPETNTSSYSGNDQSSSGKDQYYVTPPDNSGEGDKGNEEKRGGNGGSGLTKTVNLLNSINTATLAGIRRLENLGILDRTDSTILQKHENATVYQNNYNSFPNATNGEAIVDALNNMADKAAQRTLKRS